LEVTFTAPGYRQVTLPVEIRHSSFGKIQIPDITLTKVLERPTLESDNIVAPTVALPGLKGGGAFK
jgi:hypothetical protein